MISRNVRWTMSAGLLLTLLCMVVPSLASSAPGAGQGAAPVPAWEQKVAPDSPLYIHLRGGSFDPLQALPRVPDPLSYTPSEAAAAGVYIVQFTGPVVPEWKQAIITAGGQLGDYLPDYAFLAHLDARAKAQVEALSFVRWVGPYQPAYKLAPDVDAEGVRSYRLILAPWADPAATQTALTSWDVEARRYSQGFSAVLDGARLNQVARLADVLWIEPYYLQRLHNDVGGGTIMGGTAAWSNGYTGSGVTIAVADSGLDTGNASTVHQDFSGRVTHVSSWPVVYANYGVCEIANAGADDGAADKDTGHGTHVTGSVAGNGARSSGQFKGLGYGATVTFQAVEQYTEWSGLFCALLGLSSGYYLTGIPDDVRDLFDEAYGWGARIHNNSWGGGQAGAYDELSVQFDDFIHQHPDMVVVTSAGNGGEDGDRDGYVDENSVTAPATAKNVISIGASENERPTTGGYQTTYGALWPSDYPADPTRNDHVSDNREDLAAFSSRGPLADGRIKPDVVAPGTNILSVRSSQASYDGWGSPYNQYYMYMGGTSMASPLTAGAATLVREYYVEGEGHTNPSAALIKATLINSAVDIGGYGDSNEEAGQPIPNNHEGWGRVDVGAATTPGERQFADHTTGVDTGATEPHTYNVQSGQPFKVTLAWSDAAGSSGAGKALVNDLNLRVTAPDGTTTYWGNRFSGGWSQTGGSADTVNNVENVYVQSPAAGSWTVEVIGHNVPQGPQPFALVVDGNLSLAPEDLTVTGIQPTSAPNTGTLTGAVVSGTGFEATSTVDLVHGAEVIPGTGLVVNTAADTITADFDLDGATSGLWDVRVTNPDSQVASLADALTVLDATLPDLRISKTAAEGTVEPGSWLTYTIAINNDGYVTATGVTFTDTLPSGVTFERLSPSCDGGTTPVPGGFTCRVAGGSLGVGAGITYTLVVSVPGGAEGALVNRVVVGSVEADGDPGDNSDQATVIAGGTRTYLPLFMKTSSSVPGAPTLDPIDNPGSDGDYTVSWAAGDGPAPTSYDLEENGTTILSDYAGTSTDFSGKAAGTYTYRVRGRISNGPGPWSNAESVSVASAGDPIRNGDFEGGRDGSWTESSAQDQVLVVKDDDPYFLPVYPHSGDWLAWLGGIGDEVASITQQVTVPSDASTLSFWYWIASGDSCGNDFGYLVVGATTIDTFDLCQAENTSGWVEHTADLSVYAGQSVSLQIRGETSSLQHSNFFVDDVAFK